MFPGTLLVPVCGLVPFQCESEPMHSSQCPREPGNPGTYGHRNGFQTHMDTSRVPGTYGKQKGAWAHIGIDRVPGTYGNGRVPRNNWAPKGCLGTYGHRKDAKAHMGTGRVPGHKWLPQGCHSGVNLCPGTLTLPISATVPFRCPYLPGLYSVLICALAPSSCPSVPRLNSAANMCP